MTSLHPGAIEKVEQEYQGLHAFFGRIIQPLYAVVDTARDRNVGRLLQESDCNCRILYGEQLAQTMDRVGPYLVALPRGTLLLERLIQMGWGKSWGIFLSAPADITTVRRHLRRLLAVKLPDGRQVLFRFYDPRVLRGFLQALNDGGVADFFGPLSSIFCEPASAQEQHSSGEVLQFVKEVPLVPRLIQVSKTML